MGSNGKIDWAYSLKNGLTISTEDLKVDKGNRNVLEKLYNNYNTWQKDWREKLTISPGENKAPTEGPAPEAPAPEGPADAGAEIPAP